MTKTEQAILQALSELDTAIKQMPNTNPKPNLVPLFERIDALGRDLPPGANPELLHFLQRKSYEKARLLLEGRREEISRGRCG